MTEDRAHTGTLTPTPRQAGTIWCTALVVLVINDHLLKGAGYLPSWLTGKLSDFAGLIVAPVLLATLVRARKPVPRGICLGVIVALFAAVKLSPEAARAVEHVVALLGIPWRIWSDPTDLVALAVIPLAERMNAALGAPAAFKPTAAMRLRRAVAVAAGSIACLATSYAETGFMTAAFLVNTTSSALDVQLFEARVGIDCTPVGPPLTAADFAPAHCHHLEPQQIVPLDRNWTTIEDPDKGPAGPSLACDAVILRTDGLPDTLIFWRNIRQVRVPAPATSEVDVSDHGIYLERAGNRIYAAGTRLLLTQTVPFALPPFDCKSIKDAGIPRLGTDAQ